MRKALFKLSAMTVSLFLLSSSNLYAEAVWIDVRSKLEHMFDHIEGDLRVSHSDIVANVSELFPNKNKEIILYCAKGIRAERAKILLNNAGYTNVANAGGIDDVRSMRNPHTSSP